MSIALLVMTDGRTDYIGQTLQSASARLKGPITEFWMHDDSGDEQHRQWLRSSFPGFTHIGEGPRRGFGGAYDHAWKTLTARSRSSYVFSLEDDFTFNQDIPLEEMALTLESNHSIYQMALLRQAWSSEEIRAGGVIQRWPDSFHQEVGWVSHRLFYTTNPHLFRRSMVAGKTYPNVKDSEGHFSASIVNSDPNALFGYWGQKTDPPRVHHIGIQRKANIY